MRATVWCDPSGACGRKAFVVRSWHCRTGGRYGAWGLVRSRLGIPNCDSNTRCSRLVRTLTPRFDQSRTDAPFPVTRRTRGKRGVDDDREIALKVEGHHSVSLGAIVASGTVFAVLFTTVQVLLGPLSLTAKPGQGLRPLEWCNSGS